MTESATQRLFLALWPDDAMRDALNRTGKWLHQHWGGRRMRADSLHLTLAFLGATPATTWGALQPAVDAIRVAPFDLVFDQPGYWRHNHIGWLGTTQVPPQLGELVAAVNAAAQGVGIALDSRPHAPHVTLLRNSAGGTIPACTPVCWAVREFVLVRSRTEPDGARYEVIRRWPLSPPG